MKKFIPVLMIIIYISAAILNSCGHFVANVPPYLDTQLSFEQRAKDLLSRMTLEEKISLMMYDAPAIERLGIPKYNWWNECLHGVARAGEATVFPQAIGLAATFDESLIYHVAGIISDEARAKHHFFKRQGLHDIYMGLTFWTPNINIFRDPRWGRGQETYGEDPFLTSRISVNFIKGLQGNDPKYLKTVATAKHFAVHSGPEKTRHSDNYSVSDKDLYETYLPAFEASVKEGNVQSIMCAYNAFRDIPCCGNKFLLEEILRKDWNFDGYVVSDCGAISDFYREDAHRYVPTASEAAAEGVKAGTDLNCGFVYENLDSAVQAGLIETEKIDIAVKRLLIAMFKLGMFDPDEMVPYASLPIEIVSSHKHIAKSRLAAQKSIILLKNEEGVLPLDKKLNVAVIGPNAKSASALYGNYHGLSLNLVDPVDGIGQKINSDAKLYYSPGCPYVDGMRVYEKLPQGILFADENARIAGLNGSYYKELGFKGDIELRRIDEGIDFQWIHELPVPGKLNENFSVRWDGFLVPDHTAEYSFKFGGGIFINDEKYEKPVRLEKGKKYSFRLEMQNKGAWYEGTIAPSAVLTWSDSSRDYEKEALDAAKKSDVIIFCGGLSPDIEGEEMQGFRLEGFEYGDRSLIKLPDVQERLLKKLNALKKKIIYINISGSAVAFNWTNQNIPAILQVFYPGEQGGAALADILFGDYNPAGRLPVTFYRSVNDLGDFKDYEMKGKTYRYFDGEPLYPFGYGLSYSTFSYSGLTINGNSASQPVLISVDVKNEGKSDGEEVVQVYYRMKEMKNQPIQSLCAFKRVNIPAGQTVTVGFELKPGTLTYVDKDGQKKAVHGSLEMLVGGCFKDFDGQIEMLQQEIKLF